MGMSIFFMFASVYVVINPPTILGEGSPVAKFAIAGVLFAYGLFRFTRAFKAMRGQDEEV